MKAQMCVLNSIPSYKCVCVCVYTSLAKTLNPKHARTTAKCHI